MRSIVLGLVALATPAWAFAEPAPDAPGSASPVGTAATEVAPEPSPDAKPEPESEPDTDAPPEGRPVLDRVLPCGTRVLVARDDSLPVASVVLALEHGSEDDPAGLPGLHHALAYQLLMGNRNTAPGGIQGMVQDSGGIAFLATGPAQIRFESLIPVTLLGDLIVAEAQRFRAPTVTESLWKEALVSAKRDVPLRRATPWKVSAAAHGAPGLDHRPRVVSPELSKLEVSAVRSELARRARYEHATLVVVAPLPLEDTMKQVEEAFSDLPERTRSVPERNVARSSATVERAKATGNTFVWAIPGDPASRLWADAWCEALGRQRRGKDEPKPNRVRCVFDDDPRRPALTVRVRTPSDPRALLDARLQRLATGKSRLIRGPRARLRQTLDAENGTPLGLARRLATAPVGSTQGQSTTTVEQLTGVDALDGPPMPIETLLDPAAMVHVVPASGPDSAEPAAPEEGA